MAQKCSPEYTDADVLIEFSALPVGARFCYNTVEFMKTDMVFLFNAVDLATGIHRAFSKEVVCKR